MTAGLITAVVGAICFVAATWIKESGFVGAVVEGGIKLGGYAFAVGLLAWLFGH